MTTTTHEHRRTSDTNKQPVVAVVAVVAGFVSVRVLLLSAVAVGSIGAQRVDWPIYGSDAGATKYSAATKITRDNVGQLTKAWDWATGETPMRDKGVRPGQLQVTPLVINDTMYLSTSYNRVVALDANTGRLIWEYDPHAYDAGQPPNGTGFVHRGVAMWTDGKTRRILMNSRWRLIALDAASGKPVTRSVIPAWWTCWRRSAVR